MVAASATWPGGSKGRSHGRRRLARPHRPRDPFNPGAKAASRSRFSTSSGSGRAAVPCAAWRAKTRPARQRLSSSPAGRWSRRWARAVVVAEGVVRSRSRSASWRSGHLSPAVRRSARGWPRHPHLGGCQHGLQPRRRAGIYGRSRRDRASTFVEQPVRGRPRHDGRLCPRLWPCPSAADEGLHSIDLIRRHHETGAAAGGSLKTIKLGGALAVMQAGHLMDSAWHARQSGGQDG
jgi:hypothetical protein